MVTRDQQSAGSFAEALTRMRRHAGVTQEELAARCGLSSRGIGSLERGERRPRRFTVLLLVDGLRLERDDRAALLAAAEEAHGESVRERKTPARTMPPARTPPAPTDSPAARALACADEHFRVARYDGASTEASKAIETARSCGDEATLSAAYLRRGISVRSLGESSSGYQDLHTAVSLAELAGARTTVARALTAIAVAHHYNGELVRADAHFDRVLALARDLDDDGVLSRAVCNRGASALWLGEWGAALARFEEARSVARRGGDPVCEATALISRGALLVATGRHEQASYDLDRALALGASVSNIDVVRNATASCAESDIRTGRPERALSRLTPLLDQAGVHEWQVTDLLPVFAEACSASGDPATARWAADNAVERARDADHTIALADALRVRALVASHAQDRTAAGERLDEALGLTESMKAPYLEVRVRATAAELLAHGQQWAAARQEHARASALLDELRSEVPAELGAGLDTHADVGHAR